MVKMDAEKIFIGSVAADWKNEAKRQNLIEHTERVVALCEKFACKFSNEVERQLLIDAAWLHDIAKHQAGSEHNRPKEVKKALKKIEPKIEEEKELDNITEIILAHRKAFNPRSHVLESAILRICDKLDKFAKGQIDAEKKCKKSMKKIKKKLAPDKYEILNDLYEKELKKWVKEK